MVVTRKLVPNRAAAMVREMDEAPRMNNLGA